MAKRFAGIFIAIAEQAGIKMPSFFGFLAWSVPILLPCFALITWLWFV